MQPSACVLAAALLSLLAVAAGQTLPTAWTQGIATHYGGAQDGMDPGNPSFGTKEGSCGYGSITPDSYPYWTVGALSTSNKYSLAGPSQACGQCYEIQCLNTGGQFAGRCSTSQSIIITITDSCPECAPDHIDLQALTFNKLAAMSLGRIDMQYRRVDCTPPNPVTIEIDNNVGVGGWLRLVVEKTAGFGGITAVGIRQSGTQSWQAMNNKFGSAWEVSTTPSLPWDFQFTSDSKQTIQAPSLVMQNGQIGNIPTGVQFSLSGSTGATSINFDAQAPPDDAAPNKTAPTTPVAPAAQPPAQAQPAAAGDNCGCTDVQPAVAGGASITCAQQKAYGKCQESWMLNNNYCQLTCGNCPPCSGGAGSAPGSPAPGSPAPGSPAPGSPAPGSPAPGSPAPGSPAPGSPAPGSPAPGSPAPAGPASPSPMPAGAAPPLNIQAGSVQTSSIGSSSPAPTATAAATSCTDDTPPGANGKTCADLAATGACYTSIPSQYCLKSCYRAPCPQGGR